MDSSLTLVSNPGSASRKYALFRGDVEQARLHFEWQNNKVVCSFNGNHLVHVIINDISDAPNHIARILVDQGVLKDGENIYRIGLRIVAPSAYFLEDHLVDDGFVDRLEKLKSRTPLHINIVLEELHKLRECFEGATVVGVSDSAFHITKPDYAWNYGISSVDAERLDLKRFGYHGLSVASVVHTLKTTGKLPAKLIVCHLGSGASVTAVYAGKSLDNTMGYSPLEGVIMSTRSGNIDPTAVRVIKDFRHFDDDALEDYLNNHSGLLGLGGSSDIRELLRCEEDGDNRSRIALQTYVFSIQKAVGQMASVLGGVDGLVFTGTVAERSAPIRQRVSAKLHYLDLILDSKANDACEEPKNPVSISHLAHSKPVFVVPTNESAEIAKHSLKISPM